MGYFSMRGTFAKDTFARNACLLKQGVFPMNKQHLEAMFTKSKKYFFGERLYNSKCIWLYYCKLNCHLGELLQICNPKVKAPLDDYVCMYLHTALLVLILATVGRTVNLDISHPGTGMCSPLVAIAHMEFYESALSLH